MKDPGSHTDGNKITGTSLLTKGPLIITISVGFKKTNQRISDNTFDHFGENTSQVYTSVLIGLIDTSFFKERRDVMDLPSVWPHRFLKDSPDDYSNGFIKILDQGEVQIIENNLNKIKGW